MHNKIILYNIGYSNTQTDIQVQQKVKVKTLSKLLYLCFCAIMYFQILGNSNNSNTIINCSSIWYSIDKLRNCNNNKKNNKLFYLCFCAIMYFQITEQQQ